MMQRAVARLDTKHTKPFLPLMASSEQPSEEFGIRLIKRLLGNPNSWGVSAERQGKTLGSIFLHKFPPSPVAVIGPLTVHPSAEGGVGRILMDAALTRVHKQNHDTGTYIQKDKMS